MHLARIVAYPLIHLHLAILGSKLFRLNRNATILCAAGKLPPHTAHPFLRRHSDARPACHAPTLSSTSTSIEQQLTTPCLPSVTGIVSGYQFTQGFLATNMARLEAEKARLDKLAAEQDAQNTENTF